MPLYDEQGRLKPGSSTAAINATVSDPPMARATATEPSAHLSTNPVQSVPVTQGGALTRSASMPAETQHAQPPVAVAENAPTSVAVSEALFKAPAQPIDDLLQAMLAAGD